MPETLEMVNEKYNFLLPAATSIKKRQPPPTVHSGPVDHEILSALVLARYHRQKATRVQTHCSCVAFVSINFDGKLLNTGADLIKGEIVGTRKWIVV